MARRPVLDLEADKTVEFTTKGQEFSGYYLGYKTVANSLSKDGISKLHIFQTEEGKVGVWGTAKLNAKLQGILERTNTTQQAYMTFVTYGGKVKLGVGKTQHLFDIEYDDEISLDLGGVATAASSAPAAASSNDAEDASDDIGEEFGEEEEIEEAPAARAPLTKGKAPATFSKGHQAKVANMLTRK